MMAAVFAATTLALSALWLGHRTPAVVTLLAGLVLAIVLFLWEIYSPETGFRMPWIETRAVASPTTET